MKNHLMHKLGMSLLAAIGMNIFCSTDANAININNNHKDAITVIFRAAGCAGISNGYTLACNSQVVQPGKQIGYVFKGGTSYRQIKLLGPHPCGKTQNYDLTNDNDLTINSSCGLNETLSGYNVSDGKVTLNNWKRGETVKVYFTASGCSKIVDKFVSVCHSTTLTPAAMMIYRYPEGTSNRAWTFSSESCPSNTDQRTGLDGYLVYAYKLDYAVPEKGCDLSWSKN
jgi:hypothetical protein